MEVDILLPAPVRSILSTLQQQGHSAFAVGGCVRDSLMGRAPHDWDVCTSARPGEIKAAFPGKCLSAPGIRHGTVTVLLEHTPYEVTTFRTDGAYSDHRRPDSVRFVRSVTDDLARRDFTVNAMAYSPAAGLIDPFGGAADLAAKRLRCVGEPARRFSEDVLRVLRMARFAATMGFSVEPQTAAAALAKCGALTEVAIDVSDAAWENAVSAIQAAPDDLTVRMGLLFCAVEPEQAAILCPDAKTAEIAAQLALYADAPLQALPPVIRRWLHTLGPEVLRGLTLLQAARAVAHGDGVRQDDLRDFAAALGRTLATGACYDRSMLAVNGADALAAGIREGVAVGAALEELLEKVIEGTLPNSRGVLLEQLASMGGTGADSCEQESLF